MDDFNYSADAVVAPYNTGFPVAPGTVAGTNYSAVLAGGNYFHSGNFSGSILVTQPSVLYVTGNVGTPLLRIAPGGTLTIYVGGTSFSVSGGNGVVNESGRPGDLTINGLPNMTTIGLGGNQSFNGSIYAPNAVLDGNGTVDFFGAILVKRIDGLGNIQFHFDEALLKSSLGDLVISSWDEI
ncbi:MAG: hypothetical protein HC814_05595 [Rhodobacteraceae bacterium]|nr:hypothetical protein [Paracoccaceae bacterium]